MNIRGIKIKMHIKGRSSIHENKEVEAFWKEQLSSEVLDFSVFNSDNQLNKETPCEFVQVIVNVEFSKSIQKISKSQDLLLFSWFQAALRVCLAHYTDQERVTISIPIIEKNLEQSENLNKLIPLGSEIHPHHTFKQLVNEIEQTTLFGYENQEYPLSELLVKHNLTPFQIVIGMEGLHNENSLEEYAENNLVLWIRRKWNEIHNEFEFQISCKSVHSLLCNNLPIRIVMF